ncbi:hypothetical protein B0H11DRAFT_2216476 [Mycena galericulata]|nr:hypothetical protein B0H11DRAFT_2216476 [Mycena galericulata]
MRLRVSSKVYRRGRRQPQLTELPKWEGLLLDKDRKILMPLLLAHRHPQRQLTELPKWEGLPLDEDYKILMALLLAHGASKVITMETIVGYLGPLAEAAKHAEDEYLEMVKGMIKEAEDAIPDLSIV